MSERLVRGETAVEFFREQLERAMDHQKVSTSTFTQFYLVNLLAGCLRGELPPSEPGYDETPLALLYVRAIQSSRRDRAKLLRAMGDTALFVSGFFADSLQRTPGGPRLLQGHGRPRLRAPGRRTRTPASSGPRCSPSWPAASPSSRTCSARSPSRASLRQQPVGDASLRALDPDGQPARGRPARGARHHARDPRRGPAAVTEASPVSTLLVDVQRRLEALYALEHQAPVTEFLIPVEHAARTIPAAAAAPSSPRRATTCRWAWCWRTPCARGWPRADPRVHLDRENLDPFCVAAEEVSHFVYLFFCARAARQVTQLELELQGEVDKYLSSVFLLCLQNEGAVSPLPARAALPAVPSGRPRHGRGRPRALPPRPATSPIATAGTWSRASSGPRASWSWRAKPAASTGSGQRDKLERIAALQ